LIGLKNNQMINVFLVAYIDTISVLDNMMKNNNHR